MADFAVAEALEKYGLEKENPRDYCIAQVRFNSVCFPRGCFQRVVLPYDKFNGTASSDSVLKICWMGLNMVEWRDANGILLLLC